MKWVKIAGAVLAVLIVVPVLAVAIAGAGADSNRLTASIVIHQKPEAVWPWLYKPEKVKQWVTWLVEIRERGDGEPAVGQSSVWVMEDRNNGNARMEITGTVEAVEPNRRIAVKLSATEGFMGNTVYTLTPLPDGSTRLDSDSRYRFDNGFARFMTPVICWQAKKKMLSDLEQLRARVEGGV
uniref:Polyketide cyclase/dehydrase n=1 Tax=Solibacter usitatus (strain Ellin6076) TaxID=234267 RepID=Q01XD7_SOLUE